MFPEEKENWKTKLKEFSKPWSEREKERVVGMKEEETRRESNGGAGSMVVISCSLCSGVKPTKKVLLSEKQVLIRRNHTFVLT